jgi:hypothetical protein
LTRFSFSIFFLFFPFFNTIKAQDNRVSEINFFENISTIKQHRKEVFPNPKTVMRKSMIIPGWGQITNKQVWKVPVVYGLIGGLTYYSVSLTKDYHDYRAAYYNLNSDNQDFKFGPTPAYLENANLASLLNQRDFLRNKRDFIYVTIGLAYILNFIDAYVFAHLRPFDVSDDLSVNMNWIPSSISHVFIEEVPAICLQISIPK